MRDGGALRAAKTLRWSVFSPERPRKPARAGCLNKCWFTKHNGGDNLAAVGFSSVPTLGRFSLLWRSGLLFSPYRVRERDSG